MTTTEVNIVNIGNHRFARYQRTAETEWWELTTDRTIKVRVVELPEGFQVTLFCTRFPHDLAQTTERTREALHPFILRALKMFE